MTYSIAEIMKINITYGWLIAQITKDGSADKAGLQDGNKRIKINEDWVIIGGDIIIAVDGTRVVNGAMFMSYLQEYTWPGKNIIVTVIRDNQIIDISVVLGTRPSMNYT